MSVDEATMAVKRMTSEGQWVNLNALPGEVVLDGYYKAEDLEAIITVLRAMKPVRSSGELP